MRFIKNWFLLLVSGFVLSFFSSNREAYLTLDFKFVYQEDLDRVVTKISNPNPWLISVNYILFPERLQFLNKEDCVFSRLKQTKQVSANFTQKCKELKFNLKNSRSIHQIFASVHPSFFSLLLTTCFIALVFLSNRFFGVCLTFFYLVWVVLLNRFNYFYLPVLSFLVYFASLLSKTKVENRSKQIIFVGVVSMLATVFCLFSLHHKVSKTIFHPDENTKIRQIESLLESSGVPSPFYLHPLLLIKLGGKIVEWFSESITKDSISFFARFVNIFSYVGTGLVVFWLGNLLGGFSLGLISSLIWFSFLLPFVTAVAIKEDMLMCFWLSSNSVFILKFFEGRRISDLLFAFLFAGLAFSSKYSGLLAIGYTKFIALWSAIKFRSWWITIGSVLGLILCLVVFVLINDINLSVFDEFARGFKKEVSRIERGHFNLVTAGYDYLYLFYFFHNFLGYEGFFCGILIIAALMTARGELKNIHFGFLLCLFLIFYLVPEHAPGKAFPQYHRYILPCYVFISPLIAHLIRISKFAYLIFFTNVILTTFFKSQLAYGVDTTEESLRLSTEARNSNIEIAYFAYSFPQLTGSGFLMDKINQYKSRDLNNPLILVITNNFFCDRFYKGRVYTTARLKFVQCSVVSELVRDQGKFGNALVSRPFFNPEIKFAVLQKRLFRRAWNKTLQFHFN
ncbi:MAG: glycosyltransferase family 39 protein [Deltaproteobacteria bacterium]|nr:glycosyltransferase family 39 protein [Deltaproteobacteria bacterium]